MKKTLSILLALVIMLCVTACSAGGGDNGGNSSDSPESALAVLNSVWEQYNDDEKFPVAGGDFSEENSNMEGPGVYSIADADALDASLGFPAASVGSISEAASLTHMMNANSFTCGVYRLNDGVNPATVADEIKANLSTRQWMCGFPDRLVIATISGDYVVAFFGNDEFISTFNTKLTSVYPNAEIVCDEPIA